MAAAVLQEITQLLAKLADTGAAGSIDLRSLPMTDADRDELEERLGRGEVQADLSVAGNSQVWETGYSGVWWIRHLGAGDKIAAEEIAVTNVPEILVSHSADIATAALRIRRDLAEEPPDRMREDDRNG
jgi:hydrogenase-1 operon protein HyaF